MPVTDRREPAVYVTIEDASYVAPSLEIGRIVYGVILCDQGPHNRIVTLTSKEAFRQMFGEPDIRRVSQTFYQLDKALEYTNKVMVCRVVPEDSYWANSAVKISSTASTPIAGVDYNFVQDNNVITPQSQNAYDEFEIGDFIYADGDTVTEACQIISKDDSSGFSFVLDKGYSGASKTASAVKYTPYIVESQANISDVGDMPDTDLDSIYYFYALGAGAYYNNIRIKGTRNVELEKMYTDDD